MDIVDAFSSPTLKVRQGKADTFYENLVLNMLGVGKLKDIRIEITE